MRGRRCHGSREDDIKLQKKMELEELKVGMSTLWSLLSITGCCTRWSCLNSGMLSTIAVQKKLLNLIKMVSDLALSRASGFEKYKSRPTVQGIYVRLSQIRVVYIRILQTLCTLVVRSFRGPMDSIVNEVPVPLEATNALTCRHWCDLISNPDLYQRQNAFVCA